MIVVVKQIDSVVFIYTSTSTFKQIFPLQDRRFSSCFGNFSSFSSEPLEIFLVHLKSLFTAFHRNFHLIFTTVAIICLQLINLQHFRSLLSTFPPRKMRFSKPKRARFNQRAEENFHFCLGRTRATLFS